MMQHRLVSLTLPLAALLLTMSCSNVVWGPEQQGFGKISKQAAALEQGRKVYATYCVGCHGEPGDGNGPAARFLSPTPRDFRVGRLKFATVAAGSAPRDEDYLRTINRGLNGTAMPAFNLLNEEEKRSLILYVRGLKTGESEAPAPAVAIPEDPWSSEPSKGIAEGERLYHGMAQCFTCHPAFVPRSRIADYLKSYGMPVEGDFRENLYESVPKESEWGADIVPPNFLVDRLKAGSSRDDLVRSIATGVGGTAMPSWASALQPEQLWGLAYYVESLARMRETPQASALLTSLQSQRPPAGDVSK
jgi:mono/diheme cytochrome c family protein